MNTYATVRVGVAGATGYAGVELIRRLSRHPSVSLAAAMGSVGSEPRRIPALNHIWDAPVQPLDLDQLAALDAVFLATPDTLSAEVGPALAARGPRVFDLSGAFRLRDKALRERWYPHSPDPKLPVTYGLTERYRGELEDARLIACAGCYPTAAILSLQPLAAAGLLEPGIIIDAKSGVSGRRQDAVRAHALLRDSRQHGRVRRLRPSARRGDRTGGRAADHVRAAPRAARSRHSRNDLRAR